MANFSEDELIGQYFAPLAGPGGLGLKDDAALISVPDGFELVLTKDALVAGVHFFPDDSAADIARKALRVNLSDLAAKGATPCGFLLALALPPTMNAGWIAGFARGLGEDAKTFAIPLLGGDTVKTPGPLVVSITALGLVPKGGMVRRTGVRAGDHLYVTGTIGDSALGLRLRLQPAGEAPLFLLGQEPQKFLLERYLLPQPRLNFTQALRANASGAMDVSDGFIGDMRKMLLASGTGGRIELAKVPFSGPARDMMRQEPSLRDVALTGGDDYEIICSVPRANTRAFEQAARLAALPIAKVGMAVDGPVSFVDGRGQDVVFGRGAYSHF